MFAGTTQLEQILTTQRRTTRCFSFCTRESARSFLKDPLPGTKNHPLVGSKLLGGTHSRTFRAVPFCGQKVRTQNSDSHRTKPPPPICRGPPQKNLSRWDLLWGRDTSRVLRQPVRNNVNSGPGACVLTKKACRLRRSGKHAVIGREHHPEVVVCFVFRVFFFVFCSVLSHHVGKVTHGQTGRPQPF